jgi:hypothetical protein
MHMIHILPNGAIVVPPHVVGENAASDSIDCIWLANSHVDSDTY